MVCYIEEGGALKWLMLYFGEGAVLGWCDTLKKVVFGYGVVL